MIKRIKNEYLKIGLLKIVFSIIILSLLTILFYKYNKNINESIYILITFLGLDICILFSSIISNEYESGTFRFYLTKPVKRYKIFVYKYLSLLIYFIITLLTLYLTYCLLDKSIKIDILKFFLRSSIPIITVLSIIMLISTIIKNSSISTSLTIAIFLLSNLISQILFGFNIRAIQYTFLPYLDYSIFDTISNVEIMNEELNINLSLNRGIVIDIIYSIVLLIISIIIFTKKDIKS